jgi:adenine-specific DNA methylase
MFIGKFSEKYTRMGEKTPAKEMLTDASLIKWDNKNNETIISKARKLIWVAHNVIASGTKQSAKELLSSFDLHYQAIKTAEQNLYSLPNRHIPNAKSQALEAELHNAIEAFLDKMPKVFDPFAGGGAIPLEAARLGCRSFGNDINPVAHIIQKGSLEFPQKYGKPITYSKEEFIKLYGRDELVKWCIENGKHADADNFEVEILNRLTFDVEFHAKKLVEKTEKEIGYLYPADERGIKPIAYYWSRVGTCCNPSCKAEIPLLKEFYLCNITNRSVYLKPEISGNNISFKIERGQHKLEGWIRNRKLICPCCGSITDTDELKRQSINNLFKHKLLAVIEDSEEGKCYRLPNDAENEILDRVPEPEVINEEIVKGDSRNLWLTLWGIETWGQMFSRRELLAMNTLVKLLNQIKNEIQYEREYCDAIVTYLSIFIDRIAQQMTSFGLYKPNRETLASPFGRQAIPMVFDYPEPNPFCNSSGSASNQLDWILRYITGESNFMFSTTCIHSSSGEKNQFDPKYLTCVVTDPPYYDAIAYADLSDFFYVWLKRTLGSIYPLNFATPQTPKTEECTALKHHHNNSNQIAKKHFEDKLMEIFDAIEFQTTDIVSIMFAHQSTEAWTTLCNSILSARMNITGSWAIDTEMANRNLALSSAALASSVTVSCIPSQRKGIGQFKEVKKSIEKTVFLEVSELYRLGFRGADLLTACFGQAVSEFGKYERVEKADGSEVTVAELLEMARESAFNALLKGFDGDDFTKFYIGWLQLYGFVESDFDDAAKFSRVGLSINVSELFTEYILIKKGNKQTLGTFEQRKEAKPHLGEKADSFLIDQVHRAMALYKGTNRNELLQYIGQKASSPESSFWRVVTSLCEILPSGCDDHKQATGLHTNKESLIRESKFIQKSESTQTKLFE